MGATLGLIALLSEMRYHVSSATRGPAYGSAVLCAGIVLGLWIPRRFIRRRLERGASDPHEALRPDPANSGVRVEFAALLSGALIVSFALTWVLLCGGAMAMEEYRAFLARRFLHPLQLRHLLLSLPVYAGLVLAGTVGTTLLVALHGWYRLLTQPHTNLARLWTSMLVGALAAGLLAYQVGSLTTLAWLAPLAVFLAAIVAVFRRWDAVGIPSAPAAQLALTRDELMSLLAAALAAATTGTALFLASPPAWVSTQDLVLGVTVLAGAACAGLLAARAFSRLRFSVDWGPIALLLGTAALLLPYQQVLAASVNTAYVRLAAVTCCAAACVVLVGRRISQSGRSVQHALSRIGGFVAAGFGLTLALLPASAARWNPATPAMIVALAATAGAGLLLVLDGRLKAATRVAGLICVGLWLSGMPSAGRALSEALRTPAPTLRPSAPRPLVDAARRLIAAQPLRTARLRPLPPSAGDATIWQFDLAGPALDVAILEGTSDAESWPACDTDLGRRVLKRMTTRLAAGGRLLIELPTAPFVAAALEQFDPAVNDPKWGGYRLRVWGETDAYEALVFGTDIPALIKRHRPLTEFEVSLRPLRAAVDAPR